ncbi:hypothetical protein BBJ29_002246 [Phytophthora kernoviae]|uniref:Sulfhydryl oxidase n=1 Tax=Phytophthora kernoviae TaxID=325452 RepID=A0A3F2RIN8_9STRA|nr:hypothetical protein BBP00_00007273 [Phytophthora kernoviae]RLN70926.1 hypothetical protein BBJ29_002246 [Phytophthora kernoviae]
MGFFTRSMPDKEEKECPVNRETLGNATWALLHTMGLAYPDKPSPEYQAKARTFMETLALLYPCGYCAEDFQKEVAKNPPRVNSRTTFSLWLCEQHNLVSIKLDKPTFECTMANLEERWWTGKPGCQSEK